MFYGYVVAFITLIVISIGANIIRKISKSKNVVLHALSYVPITCSLMTIFWGFSLFFVLCIQGGIHSSLDIAKDMFMAIFLSLLGLATLLSLALCIYILWKFAKRNLKKYIAISYIACFFLCGAFGAITCVYFFFNAPWHSEVISVWHTQDVSVKEEIYFSYESQRLPALCAEYNLRLGFKSGKFVNLHSDTCGQSDYTLYKLKNGNIYMQAKSRQPSYVVDLAAEEVYYHRNAEAKCIYKLNGEAISGYGGNDFSSATFLTYKGDLNNRTGSFTAKAVKLDGMLDNKTLLGDLSVYHFKQK